MENLKAQVAASGLATPCVSRHVKARYGFSEGSVLVVPRAAIPCPMS